MNPLVQTAVPLLVQVTVPLEQPMLPLLEEDEELDELPPLLEEDEELDELPPLLEEDEELDELPPLLEEDEELDELPPLLEEELLEDDELDEIEQLRQEPELFDSIHAPFIHNTILGQSLVVSLSLIKLQSTSSLQGEFAGFMQMNCVESLHESKDGV